MINTRASVCAGFLFLVYAKLSYVSHLVFFYVFVVVPYLCPKFGRLNLCYQF